MSKTSRLLTFGIGLLPFPLLFPLWVLAAPLAQGDPVREPVGYDPADPTYERPTPKDCTPTGIGESLTRQQINRLTHIKIGSSYRSMRSFLGMYACFTPDSEWYRARHNRNLFIIIRYDSQNRYSGYRFYVN